MDDYNLIADKFDEVKFANNPLPLSYNAFLNLLIPNKYHKTLDFGCGTGHFTKELAKTTGQRLMGVDVSEKMLELAQTVNGRPNIDYDLVSEHFWKQHQNYFDCVISIYVFCVFSNERQIKQTFKNIYNSLKPMGEFYLLLPDWENGNGKKYSSGEFLYKENLTDGDQVKFLLQNDNKELLLSDFFWAKNTYIRLLEANGFKLELLQNIFADKNDSNFTTEKYFSSSYILKAKKIIVPNEIKYERESSVPWR